MIHGDRLINKKVLIVNDELTAQTANGRASRALVQELRDRDVTVIEAISDEDGQSVVLSDPSLQAILLDWTLSGDDLAHDKARALLTLIRGRNIHIPIFLIAQRNDASTLTSEVMREADELIWMLEDTTIFIAGRVVAAICRYREAIVPALTKALIEFARVYEYSWHTPGHTGGTAFLKSPVGRIFYDYFGENLLRSDLSISVGELGSLLDHSGPIGESEKYAARVFGAHRSYTITNGTSTSNRVIFMSSVTKGDYALCDRNAHKSIEQALTLTGVVPTYLVPTRNHLGIIGPIHPERLTPEAVKASIAANPLAKDKAQKAVHAIITNSTYDGLTYLVPRVVELLDKSVDRIHFDEAWYGYARFNPIYDNRFGMYGDPKDYPKDKPTIFTTTSTHKLLAALSQASLINVRDGRNPVEHARFNESFMMHASTSPQYAIIVSNEVSAAMMDGVGGLTLTTESITEAVAFRKALCQAHRAAALTGDWMFKTWNADEVTNPAAGKKIAFADAPDDLLITDPNCWVLHPGESWHGFKDLEDNYCMLDPIKVSVVTPGLANDGSFEKMGIPATLVTAYLDQRGIQVEKTTDYTILFLFSLGVTKGKYGTLINALLHFKEDYDANTPLSEVLIATVANAPERYAGLGLRDLADEMFAQMKTTNQLQVQEAAFSTLPIPAFTPADTYSKLVHNEVEQVAVDKMANRIVATGVVPYPPGIPMLMPGENVGDKDSPYLGYLIALQAWDRRFPGFGHETHGVDNKNGTYYIYCLK
ncbi:MAG: Orn/Lys/Arg decarboxylase N-terminal domain-containing protein [Anaerolineaceae bacterium]|nr:Orn/Lys/Arg decarboxylase N-terminal domain-containing protein [Anaerolineaceae bacterium]